MEVVTLNNEKGGVGKTSLAVHLAAGLAKRGLKVLVIDADAQGHASIQLGMAKEPAFYTLAAKWGQAGQQVDFRQWLRGVPPEHYMPPGEEPAGMLTLIPSDVTTRNIATDTQDALAVYRIVNHVRKIYDFCVIDTGAAPSTVQSAILLASTGLIIPTKAETLSFDGVRETLKHLDQNNLIRQRLNLPPLPLLGIVPNQYRAKTVEHSENLADLIDAYGDVVWEPIPQLIGFAEATRYFRPIYAVDPRGSAARKMDQFVTRTLEAVHVEA